MVGRTLGHYRILEKIGTGGMGEVYRARDEHLDRDVAIKILPAGTLADQGARKRFHKEALALSKLNHPNIASVFDFDTHAGLDFLVMEHIPGLTLSEMLQDGPLTEKDVLHLGMQLAEALAAAHAQGVVHRDLKPGNLRVMPDRRLKMLDFGLAKLWRPAREAGTTESLTETHALAGTLPYMAPEQLQGKAVDARSDLWAAGVVLYEMATGRRPFRETLMSTLIAAIAHQAPTPPTQLSPKISARLEDIILKCLEKGAETRYQSAKELLIDLRRISMTPHGREPTVRRRQAPRRGRIRSLAVLPLENLSEDPAQEYFVDGMTEALITDLAKIGALRVISRTSAMRYKDTDKCVPEIARELNVDAVVEGSVLRAGDRVRITAQLIDAARDEHLWAESYERDLRDILTLQSQVAQAIAGEIRVKLSPQERTRLATARPVNPAAHEAYLKGRYHWSKWHAEGLKKAVEYSQQAIEKDPTYAPAYAGLAEAYVFLGYWGYLSPREVYPKAKVAALRALALDETLAEAHRALGAVRWYYDWDLAACEKEFQRALELNPNHAEAHIWYSVFLSVIKEEHEKSLAGAKCARELDPFSSFVNVVSAWIFYWARQYERAIEQARNTLELDPQARQAYRVLGTTFVAQQAFPEAIDALQKAVEASRDPLNLAHLGMAYAMAGKTDQARALLGEVKEKAAQEHVSAICFAWLHAGLGENDMAFEWFERAYQEREPMLFWIRFTPTPDPLRQDPRFRDLVRRMSLPS